MPTATETMAGQIKEKRGRLVKFYEKKGPDGTLNITAEERDQMKSLNTELNDIVPKYEQLRADEKAEDDNRKALDSLNQVILPTGFHGGGQGQGQGQGGGREFYRGGDGAYLDRNGQLKGLGDHFVESKSYKSWLGTWKGGDIAAPNFTAAAPDANIKTLFQTTAGWAPFVIRQPGVVLSAQQQPKVVDLIPSTNTDQHAIKWMLETTYSNAAAEVAEGGTYQESQFALTEETNPVQKIGVTIPLTDEQLADEPGARGYLNGRLELGIKQRFDSQLLNGSGSSPNLQGLYNTSGIQSQALGGDPVPDSFYKAMVLIQSVGFADPSGMVMHPQNWQDVRLLKTSQGLYIWGSPDDTGPQRMWGLPVVTTTYCAMGGGLVADFVMYTQIYMRQGVEYQVTNSHAAEFLSGIQRIRASIRVAFIVTRPLAVCQVTGLRAS